MVADYGLSQYQLTEEDIKNYGVWFCDTTHCTPPIKPLYFLYSWLWPGYRSISRAYEHLSIPSCRGWDVRSKYGRAYVSLNLTSDDELEQRKVEFKEKIIPYLTDYNKIWDEAKYDLLEDYQNIKKKYGLDSFEAIRKLSNVELLDMLDDYKPINYKAWDVHMDFFVPMFYLHGLFVKMCKELAGIDANSPLFTKVMSGFDSMAFQFNREIAKLCKFAIDLGVDDIISNNKDEEILEKLDESEKGKEWVEAYNEFLVTYGWRTQRMNEWSTPFWLEKPSLGFPLIKITLKNAATSNIEELREASEKERVAAEEELLEKIPVDHRNWVGALMKAAQNASHWSEDHTYYTELYNGSMGRWIFGEIGRRFEENNVLDDKEDIFFLMLPEIEMAITNQDKVDYRERAAKYKKEWETHCNTEPEPLIGNPQKMGEFASKDGVMGATAAHQVVREDVKADLYGSASTTGMVEGIARVVMDETELINVHPGDILVAPATSAQWTPVFEMIKGIVTDGGGAVSHALIVAREYGIPAVVGTQTATSKIKTGDKIRIDADLNVVYIEKK